MAENNLYIAIAHIAFERKKLISYLIQLTEGDIAVPANINNTTKFKQTYLSIAKEILNNIDKEKYALQKKSS